MRPASSSVVITSRQRAEESRDGSVRDLFVGLLFAVGAILCLYKGYSKWENWLLNAAGSLVGLVALIPMHWPESMPDAVDGLGGKAKEALSWHGAFAVAFFLCIAAVCWFCSTKTLKEVVNPEHRAWYRRTYRALGVLMVTAPLLAYLASMPFAKSYTIIAVESFGVFAFGVYWLVKTIELENSNAEQQALTGHLDMPVEPATLPEEQPRHL